MNDRAVHDSDQDRARRDTAARVRDKPAADGGRKAGRSTSPRGTVHDPAMRDLDQLRERSDETSGRKLGLFALAGTLGVAAVIAFGVVAGSSEGPAPDELDPLTQLALTGADPKAPPSPAAAAATPTTGILGSSLGSSLARGGSGQLDGTRTTPGKQPASVQLDRLSFPATLIGDESALEAAVRAAEAEHAAVRSRAEEPRASTIVSGPRMRPSDVPAAAVASSESERLSRAAKHDPLMAQVFLRPRAGEARLGSPARVPVAPSGSEGAFTLQVSSYDSRGPAEHFATALRARGHRAFVASAELPGRGRSYRVRVGPFTTRRDALAYQTSFELDERMHSILVTQPLQ